MYLNFLRDILNGINCVEVNNGDVYKLLKSLEPTKGLEPLTCALRVLNLAFVLS